MLLRMSDLEKYRMLKMLDYPMETYAEIKKAIGDFYKIINDKSEFNAAGRIYNLRSDSFFNGSEQAIKLADEGYAPAQLAAAANNILFHALETDIELARKDTLMWLNGAAEQGKKEAYYLLALLYRGGIYGLQCDEDEIISLLEKADSKEGFANRELCEYFQYRNPVKAKKYFDKASAAMIDFDPSIRAVFRPEGIDMERADEVWEEMDGASKRMAELPWIWVSQNEKMINELFRLNKSELCEKIIDMMTQEELKYKRFLTENQDAALVRAEAERDKLREENKKLKDEQEQGKKDFAYTLLENQLTVEERKNEKLTEANNKLTEENNKLTKEKKELMGEIRRINSEHKKSAKDEKYGSKKTREVSERKHIDKDELARALAENKRLADEVAHVNTVCDNRGEALAEANRQNDALQAERDELLETVCERDKTIESQRRHIQELNRSAKFQPKEAQNITAEDMVRALQAQQENDHLKKRLSELMKENKTLKEENVELIDKLEQYEVYGFAKD